MKTKRKKIQEQHSLTRTKYISFNLQIFNEKNIVFKVFGKKMFLDIIVIFFTICCRL